MNTSTKRILTSLTMVSALGLSGVAVAADKPASGTTGVAPKYPKMDTSNDMDKKIGENVTSATSSKAKGAAPAYPKQDIANNPDKEIGENVTRKTSSKAKGAAPEYPKMEKK